MARRAAAWLVPLTLAACGPADNEPGVGGVTVGEARALDEAAEMLDEQRLPPEAFEPSPAPERAEAGGEASPATEPEVQTP